MARSNEAFWWSLFSAGGVLAAMFLPAFVLVTGFILPTGDSTAALERYERLVQILGWWPVRLSVFLVIFLSFFHCAHRVRHTLMDVGLRRLHTPLLILCYSMAFVGTGMAVWVLSRIG